MYDKISVKYTKALTKSAFLFTFLRELAAGASHKGAMMFVASEPRGRKLSSASRTSP